MLEYQIGRTVCNFLLTLATNSLFGYNPNTRKFNTELVAENALSVLTTAKLNPEAKVH